MKLITPLIVLLLCGCATSGSYMADQSEFEAAQKIDTVAAYDAFLVKHPNSAWRPNVEYARDKAAYYAALASSDVNQMKDFLAKYPKSAWAELAQYHVDHASQQ